MNSYTIVDNKIGAGNGIPVRLEKGERITMGRRTKIPKSASVIACTSGIVNKGPNKGKRLNLTRYAGYASMGYKSDYTRVEHGWLTVEWPDEIGWNRVYQYSGKNLVKLDELWEDAKSLFDDSGDSDSDSVTSEDTTTTTTSATVTTDRDWTWVAFASKPAEDIRKRLTALGGRWSRKRGSWYFRTLDVDLSWLA